MKEFSLRLKGEEVMVLENLKLYRRRYIPDELVFLKDDKFTMLTERYLRTEWKTIRPKAEYAGGRSVFCFDKGWKISRMIGKNGETKYWYCDICEFEFNEQENTIVYNDLLFDVVVDLDGRIRVVDCNEAAQALSEGLISDKQMIFALNSLDEILNMLQYGNFDDYKAMLE